MSYVASLRGRRCLVTGATSGHGRALAVALAEAGAQVVLLGRDPARCDDVQREIARCGSAPPAEVVRCDLSSAADIRWAADELLADGRPLHVLVNNAGLVKASRTETVDGHEMTFAVNYLACFQLTLLLLPRLRQSRPARIVNVCSDMHRVVRLDLDDVMGQRRYRPMVAYGRSKLAQLHFTRTLAQRLGDRGITVNALDPGPVASGIADREPGLLPRLASALLPLILPRPEDTIHTALYLASAPELLRVTGGYYKFGRRRTPSVGGGPPDLPARLWRLSAALTGVDLLTHPLISPRKLRT